MSKHQIHSHTGCCFTCANGLNNAESRRLNEYFNATHPALAALGACSHVSYGEVTQLTEQQEAECDRLAAEWAKSNGIAV